MEEAPLSFLMAFLLPFHIGGGAALGIALRRIIQDGLKLSSLAGNGFFLLWGSMFGGLPLVFGLVSGSAWLVVIQLAVFLGTIVAVSLGYEWLRDLYSHPGMFVASFGLVFFVIGAALTVTLLGEGDSGGLPVGLIFAGIGGTLTLIGIWLLLRSQ